MYSENAIEKKLDDSLRSIKSMVKQKTIRVLDNSFGLKGALGYMKQEPDGDFHFKLLLDGAAQNKLWTTEGASKVQWGQISFESGEFDCTIPKNKVKSYVKHLGTHPMEFTIKATQIEFKKSLRTKSGIQRLVIPTDKDTSFIAFKTLPLKIGSVLSFQNLIEIKLENKSYHLFLHEQSENRKEKFLVVDALEEQSFEEFQRVTRAIILSFGYVTGDLHQEQCFYQLIDINSGQVSETTYIHGEKSVFTSSTLFHPIYYEEYLKAKGKSESIVFESLKMENFVFNNIVNLSLTNHKFEKSCLLKIEASSVKRKVLRAAIYSIGIETIASLIYAQEKERLNPIADKTIAEEVSLALKKTLESFKDKISEQERNTLQNRLEDINKPINSEKLLYPFKHFGISLSKEDKKILSFRNKFLHGSSPKITKELELAKLVERMAFLFNVLILKYAGYSGHIINNSGWIEFNAEEKVSQHLFQTI